jgi:hypothetical protein
MTKSKALLHLILGNISLQVSTRGIEQSIEIDPDC